MSVPSAVLIGSAAAVLIVSGCSSTTVGKGQPQPSISTTSSATPTAPGSAPQTSASSITSSAPSVPVLPAPAQPVRTAVVHAGSTTYPISVWWQTSTKDCAAHSHGVPVVQYLTAHPCAGMTRQLATTTVKGRKVGFNVASVAFLGTAPQVYTTAGNFHTLVLADGTGSVNDLLAEGYRLPSGPSALPQPDAFTALAQDSDVTIFDVWYLDGPTPNNDPALVKMAQDVFLQY